jgi:uncharacterized protein YeeX (DUF496 family)
MPTIAINYEKVVKIINDMNEKDKERLADYVNEITSAQWLSSFRKRMSKSNITIEEINSLVEEVRTKRYENSN